MRFNNVPAARWLVMLATAFVFLSGCELFGPEESDDTTSGDTATDTPTETAIGFFNGSISGSAADVIGLVPLTAGIDYRVELSGLTEDVSFAIREGTPSNISTVIVGSAQNNGSSSVSISFTATRSDYVAGLNLLSGSSTSYSLTTYEIR